MYLSYKIAEWVKRARKISYICSQKDVLNKIPWFFHILLFFSESMMSPCTEKKTQLTQVFQCRGNPAVRENGVSKSKEALLTISKLSQKNFFEELTEK